MPTFHFMKGGVKVGEMVGASPETLAAKVAEFK